MSPLIGAGIALTVLALLVCGLQWVVARHLRRKP